MKIKYVEFGKKKIFHKLSQFDYSDGWTACFIGLLGRVAKITDTPSPGRRPCKKCFPKGDGK